MGEDRLRGLGAKLGGDDLWVLRRGQRMAGQHVELDPDEELSLVVVAPLEQRDVQVTPGFERLDRVEWQRETADHRSPGQPGGRFRLQDRPG